MARKFYAFPAGSGIEIKLDPTLVTPGAKISEDAIRALVPPGTYVFGSADDAIEVVKADTPPLAMLTPPSLTGPLRIGGEAAISPGTFTAGASVSHVLVYQDAGTDVVIATSVTSFIWTAADDGRAVRVVTTATLGAETLVVASPSQTVAYNAPTTSGALLDVTYTEDNGDKTVDASGNFAVVGDPTLAGITWSVRGTGATIDTAGVVTITTAEARLDSPVTVTATNSGGSASSTFSVTVGASLPASDQTIRFGALTPAGDGAAQARNGTGDVVAITSIDRQPSTRWTLTSGKLIATGSPAMASENITATVDGSSVTLGIVVVPNMVSVASSSEFNRVSMADAASGDLTIELRAGVTIAKAAATAKICGASSAQRVLGGTLTLTGELDGGGLPSARVEGIGPLNMSGGTFVMENVHTEPAAGRNGYSDSTACLNIYSAPSTNVILDGLVSVGNPNAVAWPGIDPGTGGANDWGLDPWGALVRVNKVSGVARHFVDGTVGSGPDIISFSGSGVKRVLLGIRAIGGGVHELQLGDRNGQHHSLSNTLVSGEGATSGIGIGNTATGLDGFTAIVIAPPAGVEAAGGKTSGGAAYSHQRIGPRWLDSNRVIGDSYANTVKTLTIRNCDVSGGESLIQPSAVDTVLIEQNKFHHFTQDCIKIPNRTGSNYRLIIRRNDIYASMQGPSDLGAPHTDYMQIFGNSGGTWTGFRFHHNRILCNARGCGQGMFNDNGTNALQNGQIFGNIFVLENGGWSIAQNMASNSQHCHNTYLINQKQAGLPENWAPNDGSGMLVDIASSSPGTDLYSGWNIARRYSSAHIKTEKNFGLSGNTSKTQIETVAGLGGARPFFFETFEHLMEGAATILAGEDSKAGALGSNSDWSGYPYRVTTDGAHLPFTLDYDAGDLG